MIAIQRTEENGLDADSAGNVLQVRSVASERFVRCLGKDYESPNSSGGLNYNYIAVTVQQMRSQKNTANN
jgi:hypothetical protein